MTKLRKGADLGYSGRFLFRGPLLSHFMWHTMFR